MRRSATAKGTPPPAPAWRRPAFALSVVSLLAGVGPAHAADGGAAVHWKDTYAGVFVGTGRIDNRIVDVEGFANWGNPGWTVDYDAAGAVGGLLVGRRFVVGGMPLRIEVDGTFGDVSASTNRLDPRDLDETAETELRWMVTLRGGVDRATGPATVFATGGLAAARIANSVTDIDFGAGAPPRLDPDDSFRDSSPTIGWTAGVGLEVPLADAWTLRFEGSYYDLGRRTRHVNRSGDNPCGADNPRRPCAYEIGNRLHTLRVALVRRFGP